MNTFDITKLLKGEARALILENVNITDTHIYDDDFTNKSDIQNNDSIILYSVRLSKAYEGFVNYLSNDKSICNLVFESSVTLQTRDESVNLGDLMLYISNDREITKRFSNSHNKLEKNIKNITPIQNSNFIENDQKWFKQILTFNFIYEGEYTNGNI